MNRKNFLCEFVFCRRYAKTFQEEKVEESSANLISLTAMDGSKGNSTKPSLPLDLDRLFSTSGTSALESRPNHMWLNTGGGSMSMEHPVPAPRLNLFNPFPPNIASPPTTPRNGNQSARDVIKSTRTNVDVNKLVEDAFNCTSSQAKAKIPWNVSPTADGFTGIPPPLPARPSSHRVSRTSLQIKRVSTPTNDLLDLSEDVRLPEACTILFSYYETTFLLMFVILILTKSITFHIYPYYSLSPCSSSLSLSLSPSLRLSLSLSLSLSLDRKSTRLNSSHVRTSRMPSSA